MTNRLHQRGLARPGLTHKATSLAVAFKEIDIDQQRWSIDIGNTRRLTQTDMTLPNWTIETESDPSGPPAYRPTIQSDERVQDCRGVKHEFCSDLHVPAKGGLGS